MIDDDFVRRTQEADHPLAQEETGSYCWLFLAAIVIVALITVGVLR